MNSTEYLAQAIEILEHTPLIDGHNDWAMYIRSNCGEELDASFEDRKDYTSQVDITRLREGRCGGVFWSAFVECPEPEDDFSDHVQFEKIRDTFQQIDLIHRLIEWYPGHLEMAQRADDILNIFRKGKIASMIGVEGLHQIGNSSAVLRTYHRLGARYVTLTHNSNNLYADCAVKPPVHGGLSEEGKAMVQEMNRVGLMVDLSHVSDAVMRDALAVSKAPVIVSHSSCLTLCDHPRNVSDAVLDLLKAKNGIIMITFVPRFINSNAEISNIDHVVDHVLHAANRIGWNHVGIGSDFDGMPKSVHGLEDVSRFPDLIAKLLAQGVQSNDIEKMLGLNLIRVLKDVEKVAESLKGSAMLEDSMKSG